MNMRKMKELKAELAQVRREAVAASIAGNYPKADCLTSKAVGMQTTIEMAEEAGSNSNSSAVGELEGIERVLSAITPVPKC